MRRPLVAGNWKMNGVRATAGVLAATLAKSGVAAVVDVVLCPSAAHLERVGGMIAGSGLGLGAQDCSEFEPGAYTGETAAEMLRDLGCSHVIIGHSERRQHFGDTDQRIVAKIGRALACGLTPILCVGETLAERRALQTEAVVGRQLDAVMRLPQARAILGAAVIAYEPVWAIGTGESATPDQAQAVHAWIRGRVAAVDAGIADGLRILYGGSVKPDNAADLFAMPDIDGGLVGGAALVADSFITVCRAAAH